MAQSAAIAGEIEQLEAELTRLRSRLDDDNSSFSSLEHQVDELRKRLAETQENVERHELRLKEKHVELSEAQRRERLEAYADDIEKHGAGRKRVTEAASAYLTQLEAYDGEVLGLEKLLLDMRADFGPDDERVHAVEKALADEADALVSTWETVAGATAWRLPKPEPEAPPVADGDADDDVAEELKRRASEGRASRILEYFNKA